MCQHFLCSNVCPEFGQLHKLKSVDVVNLSTRRKWGFFLGFLFLVKQVVSLTVLCLEKKE